MRLQKHSYTKKCEDRFQPFVTNVGKRRKLSPLENSKQRPFQYHNQLLCCEIQKSPLESLAMSWVHMWQSYCSLIGSATSKASSFDDKLKMQAPFHLFIQEEEENILFHPTITLLFHSHQHIYKYYLWWALAPHELINTWNNIYNPSALY